MSSDINSTIRNIAIIAHVDHGKTTLVDNMLKQSGTFQSHQKIAERAMDTNDLEKERGITILAKCTAINWKECKINIIDTPGHADFGSEVERVLSMAQSVLLLVDSAEGTMPQTQFVLKKALKAGLNPIVIINKIDKNDAQPDVVLEQVFESFINLEASEVQLDFPVMYASGREGWCVNNLQNDNRENLFPLFDMIISHIPPVENLSGQNFKMLISMMEYDKFLGRILIGKIYSGMAIMNDNVKAIDLDGKVVEHGKLTKILAFYGLQRIAVESATSGDIVAIAGLGKALVTNTVAHMSEENPIPSTPIDPSTMSITIGVNDSPMAGKGGGKKLTSRMIKERLLFEAETNVAITIKDTESSDAFEVGGRGELQLGVLVENMRREGFEMSVSRPKVIIKTDESGQKLEPIEDVLIDVDEDYSGIVMEKLNSRKGRMQNMSTLNGRARLSYFIPSRALIGYHGDFLTDTRGTGLMNRAFSHYDKYQGTLGTRRNGVLIATESGNAVAYAIFNLQERGMMFVKHGDPVYTGMIVGEHNKSNDLEVNVLKSKQLTNVRASGTDEAIKLVPPKIMSLEEMVAYVDNDELLEVTPNGLRLRKAILDPSSRRKTQRSKKQH